jgi:DNA polymerase-4
VRAPLGDSAAGARTILHVDMDAFYASVEQRDRPQLRGKPVIVGAAPGGRGVVAAASYEARPFGVRSAMPISRAVRLCPAAVCLPVDHDKYGRISAQVMRILAHFSPLVEPTSIDEAFLDVTASERLFGDGRAIALKIKEWVRDELRLTASVGVASNKFVAKVASDLDKPDGLVVVSAGREAAFLAPLPVARLWGVGRTTERLLEEIGIRTIGQLAAMPDGILWRRLGAAGPSLRELALGRDECRVEPWEAPKSKGAEETFAADHGDVALLEATLRRQAERVARELREDGYLGRCVVLKIRFSDFTTVTRRHTTEPTQEGLRIYREARRLLGQVPLDRTVRLIGLSVSGLSVRGAVQLPLLEPNAGRRERLARVLDRLNDRFGAGAITSASLLDTPRGSTAPDRRGSGRVGESRRDLDA